MIILDTLKAAKLFAKYSVPISGYIVNRVIPPELAQQEIPEYLRHRIEMQERYIKQINETFGDEVLTSVPEFERDITGLEMIGKVADALFGGEA
jgi:arsenite-transporting ATPase